MQPACTSMHGLAGTLAAGSKDFGISQHTISQAALQLGLDATRSQPVDRAYVLELLVQEVVAAVDALHQGAVFVL